jgi:hypothetical protein
LTTNDLAQALRAEMGIGVTAYGAALFDFGQFDSFR